jgi:hypothetical protein
VPSRPLVIDANILIRAVLGVRVRALIERYSDSVAFCVAEPNGINQAKPADLRYDGALFRHVLDSAMGDVRDMLQSCAASTPDVIMRGE